MFKPLIHNKITTLLFDCDNTLVLSESLAFSACAGLTNQFLTSHNIQSSYTGPSLIKTFVGQNFRGMLKALIKEHHLENEVTDDEVEDYVTREEGEVIKKIEADGEPCVGVDPVLESLHKEDKYELAVVSSSALRRVLASIKKVGQYKYFPDQKVFSAATSLPVPTSKPDPAIYLHACKVLGKDPKECVAIEDSKSGTKSAVAAGIKVIGYIGPYEEDEKEEKRAALTECGAAVIMTHWSEFPQLLEGIEGKALL